MTDTEQEFSFTVQGTSVTMYNTELAEDRRNVATRMQRLKLKWDDELFMLNQAAEWQPPGQFGLSFIVESDPKLNEK